VFALVGDKWPFDVLSFAASAAGIEAGARRLVVVVRPLILRVLTGLLLIDLGLLRSGVESNPSNSSSIGIGVVPRFFVEERVTGPK